MGLGLERMGITTHHLGTAAPVQNWRWGAVCCLSHGDADEFQALLNVTLCALPPLSTEVLLVLF